MFSSSSRLCGTYFELTKTQAVSPISLRVFRSCPAETSWTDCLTETVHETTTLNSIAPPQVGGTVKLNGTFYDYDLKESFFDIEEESIEEESGYSTGGGCLLPYIDFLMTFSERFFHSHAARSRDLAGQPK